VNEEAYSVACVELFRRLWVELERLLAVREATQPCSRDLTSWSRAEMLRLELALLLDACQSERWRLLLNISQRLSLEWTIEDVFDALNSSSEIAPQDAIAWAQNRLLDAILEHCAALISSSVLQPAT
jgi:hypothetical protein